MTLDVRSFAMLRVLQYVCMYVYIYIYIYVVGLYVLMKTT